MHIVVCMKQVPDPESPPESFAINQETQRVEPRGIPPVMSLFDENALEAALKMKDADKEGTKITVLSAGKRVPDAVMLKSLAAGADELAKIEGPDLDNMTLNARGTAHVLAKAIQKIGDADLILAGRQAADSNAGQVGAELAAAMDLPLVTMARKISPEGGAVLVERVLADGYEVVKAHLPCVVVVSNEVGELRYPAMKERRKAGKKPVSSTGPWDVGADQIPEAGAALKGLEYPAAKERRCEIIPADDPDRAAKTLLQKLKEAGLF
ncbi:MAG: electron transfer flavoprotein subunit beta/FixA family protein [Thermodesulfobacteriota bacterium]